MIIPFSFNKSTLNVGLIGHWPLTKSYILNDIAFDKSIFKRNASIIGGSKLLNVDNFGPTIYINAVGNYIVTPVSISTDKFSMSVWFRKLGSGNDDPIFTFFSQGDTFFRVVSPSNLIFSIITSGLSAINPSTSIDINKWYQFTGTYNGSNMILYINGNYISSIPKTGTIDNQSKTFEIGRYTGGGYNLVGCLKDARLYDRALTPLEVKALFGNGNGI